MSNTIADLSNAVKRFLMSNTNIAYLVPGQSQSGQTLEASIDDAILSAANNARTHAEKLHDFAANDKKGSAVLTFGSPINLDRVPTKRFFSGTASSTIAAVGVVGIESSLTDWPEITFAALGEGIALDVTNVISVNFGGTVNSPLLPGTEYAVISARTNSDYTTTLTLGITPGVLLNVTNTTVIFNTGAIERFKTIRSAWILSGLTAYPIKVQQEQAKMIRLMKDQGMSIMNRYPSDVICGERADTELTVNGRFGTVSPTSISVHLALSGNVWMPAYTSENDSDFLLDNGFEFMMWQTVIELNYLLLKFVSRQEGTISPPTAARDAAWEALVLWDSHSVAGNIYYDL
jgi:hypothetical protein